MLSVRNLGGGLGATKIPVEIQVQVEALAQAELKRKFDELSGAAKVEACNRLKEEFPNDPTVQGLDCSKATANQLASALAGAAGVGICAASGAGVAVATACGSLAAYLYDTFGEDIKDFVSSIGTTGTVTGGPDAMGLIDKYLLCYGDDVEQRERGALLFTQEGAKEPVRPGVPMLSAWCKRVFPTCSFVPKTVTAPNGKTYKIGSCKVTASTKMALSPAGIALIAAQTRERAITKAAASAGLAPLKPWYKRPSTYVVAGSLAAVGTVATILIRRGR